MLCKKRSGNQHFSSFPYFPVSLNYLRALNLFGRFGRNELLYGSRAKLRAYPYQKFVRPGFRNANLHKRTTDSMHAIQWQKPYRQKNQNTMGVSVLCNKHNGALHLFVPLLLLLFPHNDAWGPYASFQRLLQLLGTGIREMERAKLWHILTKMQHHLPETMHRQASCLRLESLMFSVYIIHASVSTVRRTRRRMRRTRRVPGDYRVSFDTTMQNVHFCHCIRILNLHFVLPWWRTAQPPWHWMKFRSAPGANISGINTERALTLQTFYARIFHSGIWINRSWTIPSERHVFMPSIRTRALSVMAANSSVLLEPKWRTTVFRKRSRPS
jgi:hypothetical protein